VCIYVFVLIAAVLSCGLTPLVRSMARWIGAVDQPGGRKIHAVPTPRLGGVSVVVSGVLTVLSASGLEQATGGVVQGALGVWKPVFFGGAIVFLLGVWDDVRPIPAGVKFVLQGVAAGVAMWSGILVEHVSLLGGSRIDLGALALPLTFVWIIGITNAFNLVDGLDGLAAGLAIIAAGSIATIFFLGGDAQDTLLLLILLGALLGFLPYNFNPASIFLGDSGSLVVGYVLAVTAITGSQRGATTLAVVTPLLVFGLPIVDTLLSMVRRFVGSLRILESRKATLKEQICRAKRMFEADQRHIHHRLLALGFSHRNAVLVLYALALGLASLALLLVLVHYRNAGIILLAIGLATYIGLRKLGYEEIALFRPVTLLRWYEAFTFNRRFFLGFVDMTLIAAAYGGAFVLKYELPWSPELKAWYIGTLPLVLVVQLASLYALGLYRGVWQAAEISDLIRVVCTVLPAVALSYIVTLMSLAPLDTRRFFLLDALLLSTLMVGIRSTYRILVYLQQRDNVTGAAALIYGAGRGGQLVLHELLQNPRFGLRPIGFLDDDPRLQGRRVNGMPIRGAVADLSAIIKAQSVAYLIVASRYINGDRLHQALSVCQERRIPVVRAHLKLEPVILKPRRAKPLPPAALSDAATPPWQRPVAKRYRKESRAG
jgi:UDP-GlcNAc:undecaprenyl-phosphate/decaprenyl-phosphate GlcNAc-1-phosphate transferase